MCLLGAEHLQEHPETNLVLINATLWGYMGCSAQPGIGPKALIQHNFDIPLCFFFKNNLLQ